LITCFVALLIVLGQLSSPARAAEDPKLALGRETLPANDGWASATTGATGGSAADADHVFIVTNRQQLLAALNNADPTPKIIYIKGAIDANVDDNNQPLTCADYERNGYTLEAYLAAYDPAVWGRSARPSGPLEDARVASQLAQQERIRIRVGSNTTIVGLGKTGRIRGAWLDVRGVSAAPVDNVIIRNITFQDAYDCFPQWDPTDGSTGNWNSQYDSISLRFTTHAWIDHNKFSDGDHPDSAQPLYFGRPYQIHDGQLDITNASDLVTVSWNRFTDHDKVMLIGSSDSGNTAIGDRGKLRVTIHHNLFNNVGQRAARVRFGQVHVYNNYYKIEDPASYVYSWGVGIESQIYAQNNFFRTDDAITPDRFIARFNGAAIYAAGTLVNGTPDRNFVDVVAAYNAVNDPDLAPTVSWTPTLYTAIQPTREVPSAVQNWAGPFLPE
jgi:pectate lyase